MMELDKKYLPIGTVVMLKGGDKRLMIIGFRAVSSDDIGEEGIDKVWDYSACVYPEGLISSNAIYVFDHNQIEEIYSLGYKDEEEKAFKLTLDEISKEIDEENKKNRKTSKTTTKTKTKNNATKKNKK